MASSLHGVRVPPLALVGLALASGAAGSATTTWLTRDARAQVSGTLVVPLPPQGMVFRSPSGLAVARLRGDPAGGVLEILDAREAIAVRLRATSTGGSIDLSGDRDQGGGMSGAPRHHPTTPLDHARPPYDPGY